MKRKNMTRKALITSILSLLLCVSMLVGTTFAWFTDSVESGINQIAAGNLDVELYHTNTKDANEKVSTATKLFDEVDPELWEPGAMAYENLTVKNEGSLALKYQLAINFANATATPAGKTLADVLKVGVVEGGFKGTTREAVLAEVKSWQTMASFVLPGNLQAEESDVYGIVIYWEPSANDNDYNMNNGQTTVLKIDLGVKLVATQKDAEDDSFGTDYDEDAWHPEMKVFNAQDLQAAINAGETNITVMENITLDEPIVIPAPAASTFAMRATPAPIVLNLNGKTLNNANGYVIENYGYVVITGDGTISGLGGICSHAGSVTIESGNFYASSRWQDSVYQHTLKAENTVVEINGGNFDATVNGQTNAMFNASENATITINGGNFKNVAGDLTAFDPYIFTYEKNGKLIINDGTFYGGWRFNGETATTDIYGGNFTVGFDGQSFNASSTHVVTVYGGTFTAGTKLAGKLGDVVSADFKAVDNGDGTCTVLPKIEGVELSKHTESGLYWNGNSANYQSVFYLFSAEDLVKAAAYFQHQTHTSEANRVTFELMNDIDMTGTAWTAWSVMWIQFNGNDHKISNLTTQEDWRAGFFGYIGASIVNDLTLENVTSYGAQAGTFAGSVEGVTFTDCVLKGSNAVTYKEYVSPSYTETWGGIGAVTGVVANSTINVEIANGAVVTMNNNGMVTNCEYVDVLTGYLEANKGVVVNNGEIVFAVSNTADLIDAIKNAPVDEVTQIVLTDGTYAGDIKITVAEFGKSGGDVVIKAAEGAKPVISGTVTLGYRHQGVDATMYNANITFDGITFDQAEAEKHSIDIQDVKSLTLKNCKVIGDGEYGISCARGNGTGTSKIIGCTFENAGMQLLGNYATGLVIEGCTFNDSRINVQAGNGVTVQNCVFNATLTDANVGDSFYLIRSNSTPITVKDCEINIDSTVTGVATAQAKWYLLANRGTTDWTVTDVEVTLTEAAQAQTELDVTACTSTGKINATNLTVNGVEK